MVKVSDLTLVTQAVACVDRLVESGFLDHGEAWIKAWYRFDLKWSDSVPKYVTLPKKLVGSLVASARDQPVVFDLVEFVAGTRLAAGVFMAPELQTFTDDVRLGQLVRPLGKPGRKMNWGRNFIIIRTMIEINPGALFEGEDKRFATASLNQRGVRRRDQSASEIVYNALPHTRVKMVALKSIQAIWGSKEARTAHDEAYSLHLGDMLDDLDDVDRI